MRGLLLILTAAAAVLPFAGGPAAALSCSQLIDTFNASIKAHRQLVADAKKMEECSPAYIAAFDQVVALLESQVTLRQELERSCGSRIKGGDDLSSLRKKAGAVREQVSVIKMTCDLSNAFDDALDDEDDDDD